MRQRRPQTAAGADLGSLQSLLGWMRSYFRERLSRRVNRFREERCVQLSANDGERVLADGGNRRRSGVDREQIAIARSPKDVGGKVELSHLLVVEGGDAGGLGGGARIVRHGYDAEIEG